MQEPEPMRGDPTSRSAEVFPSARTFGWLAGSLLVLTVYGSIIPLRYQAVSLQEALARVWQAPTIDPTRVDARGDWAVNSIQYGMLAFLAMAAASVDRPRILGFLWAIAVLLGGFALAAGLELLQVAFPPRTVSFNDIVVESFGVTGGVALWLAFGQRLTKLLRRVWARQTLTGLADQLLPLYVVGLIVVSSVPFDVVLGAKELAQKYGEGRIRPIPFQAMTHEGLWVFLKLISVASAFLPVGILLGLSLRGRLLRPSRVATIGLLVALGLELLQLIVYTRFCDTTDVFVGTAAVLGGWLLVREIRRILQRNQRVNPSRPNRIRLTLAATVGSGISAPWPRALLIVWAVAVVAINWQPFDFTTDIRRFDLDGILTDEDTPLFGVRRMAWAPFIDYYWASRYDAIDQFLRRTVSFAPLGILIALASRAPDRRSTKLKVFGIALVVSLVIEIGQYFIPDRHPSTTDLLIQVAGALMGFSATRHLRRIVEDELESLAFPNEDAPRAEETRSKSWRSRSEAYASSASANVAHGSRRNEAEDVIRVRPRIGRATRSRPRSSWSGSRPQRPNSTLAAALEHLSDALEALPYPLQALVIGIVSTLISVGLIWFTATWTDWL
jgi:glycopeptide antibiotics resistance protein